MHRITRSTLVRCTVAVSAALALTAPAANAATIAGAEAACAPRAFSTVFAQWGDNRALHAGAGRRLRVGGHAAGRSPARAAVVAGSSPFASGESSLSLPAGALGSEPDRSASRRATRAGASPRGRRAAAGWPSKCIYPQEGEGRPRRSRRAQHGV